MCDVGKEMKLTPSTASDEAQVVEFRHLILHISDAVAQLGGVVLVVARADRHFRAVLHFAEGHQLEGDWQRLVRPPVGRQDRADEVRTARPDQFARVLVEHGTQGALTCQYIHVRRLCERRRTVRI